MVRVGLGALGVVTDLTLQCVPAHKLVEQTYVTTAQVGPRPACACRAVHQEVSGCVWAGWAERWLGRAVHCKGS